MKKIILFLLLLLLFTIYYLNESFKKCEGPHLVLDRENIDLLLGMFREFVKYNINYFLIAGSLLGAVRNGGLMQHDDDVDIGILDSDVDSFLSIEKNLNDKGIYIKPFEYFGYKITDKNEQVWIDVFVFHKKDDKYIYKYDSAVNTWPNEWFYGENELFPLKEITFNDNIICKCPNNPIPYLDRAFGNWKKEVNIYKPHKEFIDKNEKTGVFEINEKNTCYSE